LWRCRPRTPPGLMPRYLAAAEQRGRMSASSSPTGAERTQHHPAGAVVASRDGGAAGDVIFVLNVLRVHGEFQATGTFEAGAEVVADRGIEQRHRVHLEGI